MPRPLVFAALLFALAPSAAAGETPRFLAPRPVAFTVSSAVVAVGTVTDVEEETIKAKPHPDAGHTARTSRRFPTLQYGHRSQPSRTSRRAGALATHFNTATITKTGAATMKRIRSMMKLEIESPRGP